MATYKIGDTLYGIELDPHSLDRPAVPVAVIVTKVTPKYLHVEPPNHAHRSIQILKDSLAVESPRPWWYDQFWAEWDQVTVWEAMSRIINELAVKALEAQARAMASLAASRNVLRTPPKLEECEMSPDMEDFVNRLTAQEE